MIQQTDTIVALITPPGRSGIGVIRVSGSRSLAILRRLIASPDFNPPANVLTLRNLFDPATNQPLDQAMVCYFKAPRSFTGEDVVEFHCHGSPVLLRAIIDATLNLEARMASPGEFSLRAVANGRMKLSEAEAIRDLIDAQTDAAIRQATRQMRGAISAALQPLQDQLLQVIVRLESSLEFVEDDLPQIERNEILATLRGVRSQFEQMTATFHRGRLLRDGLRVTLVGRPNTGKSSLFNMLVGHGRAIVTDIPGTTRDAITESIGVHGIPIIITDTAGLRVSTDQVEAIGVDRTKREAADSDLLILVIDGSQRLTSEDHEVLAETSEQRRIVALNKSDLSTFSETWLSEYFPTRREIVRSISVSAKTGSGIDKLRDALVQPFVNGNHNNEGLLITNARHYDLLVRATDGIRDSENLLMDQASEELTLVGLHNALRYLGELTGETTSDEILGEIFSTFCIGK